MTVDRDRTHPHEGPDPELAEHADATTAPLADAAAQLGLDPEELEAHARAMREAPAPALADREPAQAAPELAGDTRDQTIAALDGQLAAKELEVDRLRIALEDARASERAATDERDNAVRIAREARAAADAAAQERNVFQARAADRDALAARIAELEAARVEAALEEARRAGRLPFVRDAAGEHVASKLEQRLRRTAREDGLEAMLAELEELPALIPLRRRELSEHDPNPRASTGALSSAVLASTATQLGIDPEELEEHATALAGGEVPRPRIEPPTSLAADPDDTDHEPAHAGGKDLS